MKTIAGVALLAFLATTPVASARNEKKADPAPDGPVFVMEPYTIIEIPPKLSFGMALEVWSNGNTGKVTAVYIQKVRPLSHGDELGLGPRTRIDKIDGVPIELLEASFNNDTILNKTFINRRLGDRVVLEVVVEGALESRTVVIIEKPSVNMGIRMINWSPEKK